MADITSFDGISAAARTAAEVLAIIEKIDLAIYNLVAGGKNAGARYRVGNRTLDRDGYLRWLLDARRLYQRYLANLPVWETTVYDDPDL